MLTCFWHGTSTRPLNEWCEQQQLYQLRRNSSMKFDVNLVLTGTWKKISNRRGTPDKVGPDRETADLQAIVRVLLIGNCGIVLTVKLKSHIPHSDSFKGSSWWGVRIRNTMTYRMLWRLTVPVDSVTIIVVFFVHHYTSVSCTSSDARQCRDRILSHLLPLLFHEYHRSSFCLQRVWPSEAKTRKCVHCLFVQHSIAWKNTPRNNGVCFPLIAIEIDAKPSGLEGAPQLSELSPRRPLEIDEFNRRCMSWKRGYAICSRMFTAWFWPWGRLALSQTKVLRHQRQLESEHFRSPLLDRALESMLAFLTGQREWLRASCSQLSLTYMPFAWFPSFSAFFLTVVLPFTRKEMQKINV